MAAAWTALYLGRIIVAVAVTALSRCRTYLLMVARVPSRSPVPLSIGAAADCRSMFFSGRHRDTGRFAH